MAEDLDGRAWLKLSENAGAAPQDWSDAEEFPTLREALEAAVERTADAPWVRTEERVIGPGELQDLWKTVFRPLSD